MPQIQDSNTVDYHQITVFSTPETAEILIALLNAIPFEGFEETATGFLAYIPTSFSKTDLNQTFSELNVKFDFRYEYNIVKKQNWNAIWEDSFKPIIIDDFCTVRAHFHNLNVQTTHDILIDPKMSFGTGHHETTFMVMKAMQHIDFKDKIVLDFGCGTGILAILASKLGAKEIDAIDNDPLCFQSTKENATGNQIATINALLGAEEDIPTKKYEVILANINRNVILTALPNLYQLLQPAGQLIISGFIKNDEELLHKNVMQQQFKVKNTFTKNDWICMHLNK